MPNDFSNYVLAVNERVTPYPIFLFPLMSQFHSTCVSFTLQVLSVSGTRSRCSSSESFPRPVASLLDTALRETGNRLELLSLLACMVPTSTTADRESFEGKKNCGLLKLITGS